MNQPNVYLIGLGAIGATYASMAYDNGLPISIICDAERKQRYTKNGFTINGKAYDFNYVTEPDGAVDLIFVVVKDNQLTGAIEAIKPYVSNDTTIVSLMNGISSERIVSEKLNTKNVINAFSMATDGVREGTEIHYTSKGKIVFGHLLPEQKVFAEKTEKILAQSGIPYERVDDIQYRQWWKFMTNVGINQVSTLLRCPYGAFQSETHATAIARAAMREVMEISQKMNTGLTPKDIEFTFEIMRKMGTEGKTSMLQDLEAGRVTEVDMFAGEVMRLGKQYDVQTPVNELLFNAISFFDKLHKSQKRRVY